MYGYMVCSSMQAMLSHETFRGTALRKLPGGGLEWGEGTTGCLQREIREELNAPVELGRHFYTSDFFQASRFHPDTQVLIVYYLAKFLKPFPFSVPDGPAFENLSIPYGNMALEWCPLQNLDPKHMTLPTDQRAVELLKQSFVAGHIG